MDNTLLARIEKQAWFHRSPRGFPVALFSVTLALTLLAVAAIIRADHNARHIKLDHAAVEVSDALRRRLGDNASALLAAAAMLGAGKDQSPAGFNRLVEELGTDNSEHGAIGMGWARLITPGQRGPLESAMHAIGEADFHVWPQPQPGARLMLPVVAIHPRNAFTRPIIGYDLYVTPERRAVFNMAMGRRSVALSGPLKLAPAGAISHGPGLLLAAPVFVEAGPGVRINGFVYSAMFAQALLDSALQHFPEGLGSVALIDPAAPDGGPIAQKGTPNPDAIADSRPLLLGRRNWVLRTTALPAPALPLLALIVLLGGLLIATLASTIGLLITRRATEEREVLEWLQRQTAIRNSLARELNHRARNALANVISVVALTRRRATNLDEFADALTERVVAITMTHDLLAENEWRDVALGDMLTAELRPVLTDASQLTLDGEPAQLAPGDALNLGLLLHELASNAGRFGALSRPEGHLTICWANGAGALALEWRESGGPPVEPPRRRGFGLELIDKISAHSMAGPAEVEFATTGLVCRLRVPLRNREQFALRQASRGGAMTKLPPAANGPINRPADAL